MPESAAAEKSPIAPPNKLLSSTNFPNENKRDFLGPKIEYSLEILLVFYFVWFLHHNSVKYIFGGLYNAFNDNCDIVQNSEEIILCFVRAI